MGLHEAVVSTWKSTCGVSGSVKSGRVVGHRPGGVHGGNVDALRRLPGRAADGAVKHAAYDGKLPLRIEDDGAARGSRVDDGVDGRYW